MNSSRIWFMFSSSPSSFLHVPIFISLCVSGSLYVKEEMEISSSTTLTRPLFYLNFCNFYQRLTRRHPQRSHLLAPNQLTTPPLLLLLNVFFSHHTASLSFICLSGCRSVVWLDSKVFLASLLLAVT